MTSQYAGSVANGGTVNSYSNFDTVSGVATLTTANKTNNVYITGGGSGYVGDPFNFTGVATIVGQGTTNIIFNTSGTYTSSPSGGSATVNVGGTSMSFSGVSSFSGDVSSGTSSTNTTASTSSTTTTLLLDSSTINALLSQITQSGYNSIQIGQSSTGESQSTMSSSSSSGSSTDSSSDSSEDSTATSENSAQPVTASIIVTDTTTQILKSQLQLDTQQQESQTFSGGCAQ